MQHSPPLEPKLLCGEASSLNPFCMGFKLEVKQSLTSNKAKSVLLFLSFVISVLGTTVDNVRVNVNVLVVEYHAATWTD